MKKIIFTLAAGLMLVACGGKQEKKESQTQETEMVISAEEAQEINKLDEASDQIIERTQELNQELDSLINEI